MNKFLKTIFVIALFAHQFSIGQTLVHAFPDSLLLPVNINLTPGVFYVPKTATAASDFMSNGIQQNAIRTNVIESVLNSTSNLTSCLALLSTVQTDLQNVSSKCDKLIFIFEKMPAWLSSSSDGSPASTPGWYVLNTKPPANWNTWQTVVDSIASKIVTQFGITNAYFEIWNEPDLGSWTGSMSDYFTLYKRTYDGIKAASTVAKVGGPTVNAWANNIYWQPPYGTISNAQADSSLIGQLLDSTVLWNKVPDFISWHQFNISYQEFQKATNYVQQKLLALSIPTIPFIVSEWNAPSQIRDTELATAYLVKAQLELAKTTIANNVIAAWQDFSPSTTEFHNDYGLITYGGIHKPAYNGILLSNELNGITCKTTANAPFDGIATVTNDTLLLLLSNYCPPPFVEALNNTLYQGSFNINQLDSAGYINIASNSVSHLDSIYNGFITIPNFNAMQIAINNSIAIYQHDDSIETTPRSFQLTIDGHTGNYMGTVCLIDSTHNNMQYRYDSLRTAGYTQAGAIAYILPNQNVYDSIIAVNAGQYSFLLPPNAVCLFKIRIPELTNVIEKNNGNANFIIYPNPVTEKITVELPVKPIEMELVQVYNSMGTLLMTFYAKQKITEINVSSLPSGLYFIHLFHQQETLKFIKQ
jgi:Glycosyl hydrolases family 39/Secretion system C-terminal sorting domain